MDVHGLSRAGQRLTRALTWKARVRIIVFAFPVLCLVAAALFAVEALLYHSRSVAVTGTVVERYEWEGTTPFDRGQTNFEPIFTYTLDGDSYRASVGSAHSSFDVAIGETATIRAIPGDRGNVRMDTWVGMWFVPAIVALFGLGGFAVAVPLWVLLTRLFWRTRP